MLRRTARGRPDQSRSGDRSRTAPAAGQTAPHQRERSEPAVPGRSSRPPGTIDERGELGVNEGRLAQREVTFLRWVVSGALIYSTAVIVLPKCRLSGRVPIQRGDTGVSTGAPVPFHRQNQRRLPRLPEGSRKAARLWRS
jgi:hypothetical protein